MNPGEIAALIGIGALAGFANVAAGGGSLLTLPLLLFLGLPSTTANATNRICLIFQNTSGSIAFYRKQRLPLRLTLRLAAIAIPAALVGAWLAVDVDERTFRRILGLVMLVVLVPILRQGRTVTRSEPLASPPHPAWLALSFALIGFYSGFLQAGVGFPIILALVHLAGLDLVRTNAVKIATALILQVAALLVFAATGKVDWLRGLYLGLGSIIGAWLSASWQVRQGVVWVRRFLVLAVILFAIRLLQQGFS